MELVTLRLSKLMQLRFLKSLPKRKSFIMFDKNTILEYSTNLNLYSYRGQTLTDTGYKDIQKNSY